MKKYPLKRLLDVGVSTAGLILSAPLLAAIAVGVRLDSKGPVLFKQERVGVDKELFRIFKFRTMVDRRPEEIDQDNERVVSDQTDPRITRFGRFLRATSLDELPQLVNIFKGDMSLVGPRPIIPEQLAAMPSAREVRFSVRPGLTGLAQVRGRRSLDWLEQLELDAHYVENLGLKIDLQILIETVKTVLNRSGVYGGSQSNWRAYVSASGSRV